MGFRKGAYAKVWEVDPVNDTSTKLRISVSRKNKQTGEYEQDFSGYVLCIGTVTAAKAAKLSAGDQIKIGDCDVSTWYNKETKKGYTNFKIFSLEEAEDSRRPSHDDPPEDPTPDDPTPESDDRTLPF